MRVLTAGESHGKALTAIIEGIPAGLKIDIDHINTALKQRQKGYGRGKRMKIESDEVIILSGVRNNETLGSPITIQIINKDYSNWEKVMSNTECDKVSSKKRAVSCPRPGHADLVGGQKRQFVDLRNVLERSSARETAMQVAVGAICELLLNELGVEIYNYVTQIGSVVDNSVFDKLSSLDEIINSQVSMISLEKSEQSYKEIDKAKQQGTSLGGRFTNEIHGIPAGIGDYTQWDLKLDGRLAQRVMSINGVKEVSIGDSSKLASQYGFEVMDEINWDQEKGFTRNSNHLGGIEGGMSNGMPIIVNSVMKPIPTQYHPLKTVDIETKKSTQASVERSDTCVVPACSLISKYAISQELTQVILEQFDSSSLDRLKMQWEQYKKEILEY